MGPDTPVDRGAPAARRSLGGTSWGLAPSLRAVISEPRAGAVVVAIDGEIDMSSQPDLHRYLEEALTEGVRLLIVDLSDVDFMDSDGIHELVIVHQRAERLGVRVAVVAGAASVVRRTLDITGLGGLLAVHGSRDEALAGSGLPTTE